MRKTTKWGTPQPSKYKKDGHCSRCDQKRRKGSRYCRQHHNEYQRLSRKKHRDLPPETKARAVCRAYANVYLRRGKITRGPCAICGATDHIEMHHENYTKPLDIIWLCRAHHKEFHTLKNRLKDQ